MALQQKKGPEVPPRLSIELPMRRPPPPPPTLRTMPEIFEIS